jgi:hypothetical protein
METLAAQRAEIVKQMRRKEAPPELADQRMAFSFCCKRKSPLHGAAGLVSVRERVS